MKPITLSLPAALIMGLTLSCGNGTKSSQTDHTDASGQVQEQPSATTPPAQPATQATMTAEPAGTIPDFTFYILKSGIRFTKEDLVKNGNIVFVFFDPTCSHCQHEARDLGQHYERIKDVNLYFVSMNDPALMSTFLETHAKPLAGKENIELLYDRNAVFINKFHIPSQYPATYIYGADGVLKQYWNGERDIEEIITAITQ